MTPHDPTSEPPDRALRIPSITESKYFSKIIWGGAIFLLFAVVIVPQVDFSLQEDSPRADATPDPFHERVVQFEKRLQADRPDDSDAEKALDYAPMIEARALSNAGPMSAGEVIYVSKKAREYQSQIASQPDLAQRMALWNHRNNLIFEELPRLQKPKGVAALNEVRDAYRKNFQLDPATMAQVSGE